MPPRPQPTYLRRLFFTPKPSRSKLGEEIPPPPCINSARIRRNPDHGWLEVCMKGDCLGGCANGPAICIDGIPSPCICFEGRDLIAALPPNSGPRVRVLVNYGSFVSGDFLIVNREGARVRRRAIRIDDRF